MNRLDDIVCAFPEEERSRANLVLGSVWADAYVDTARQSLLGLSAREFAFSVTLAYARVVYRG